MIQYLNKIRQPINMKISKKITYTVIFLLVGIVLGIVSKALDETASNLLPAFLEMLDLRNFFSRMGFWIFSGICISIYSKTPLHASLNVFIFFAGMVSSYYIYTVQVAGFFPKSYMIIWVIMTILSPSMGAICWYAKGIHPISVCISVILFMMMARQAFSFGLWYFDIKYMLELLLLGATIGVLYKTKRQILTVIGAGMLLFFATSPFYLLG